MKPTHYPKVRPELTVVPKPDFKRPIHSARLDDLLETLDEIHTAASEHRLAAVATASRAELIAWLYEVAYLVEETLEEVETGSDSDAHPTVKDEAFIRLVRRSS